MFYAIYYNILTSSPFLKIGIGDSTYINSFFVYLYSSRWRHFSRRKRLTLRVPLQRKVHVLTRADFLRSVRFCYSETCPLIPLINQYMSKGSKVNIPKYYWENSTLTHNTYIFGYNEMTRHEPRVTAWKCYTWTQ